MNKEKFQNKPSRRSFLKGAAALGAVTSTGFAPSLLGQVKTQKWATQIGLELYTVRDLMDKDFEGILAKVAQIG
jgi:hypothetical protein